MNNSEYGKVFDNTLDDGKMIDIPHRFGKTIPTEQVKDDINVNRNHSWIKEVYLRHKGELDREVLYYFGNNITYRKIFDESIKLAKALKNSGLKKGDEFIVFIDRIPEFVYLLCAANIIGAKINFVSEKFDKNYLLEIIKNDNGSVIFVQDKKINKLNYLRETFEKHKTVIVSHKRSLINDDYNKILEQFYNHDSIDSISEYIGYDEFLETGNNYSGKIYEKLLLDDPFTVTYSSGTTKKGMPKGIVHTNRHYITMGRYHDPEVSGVPSLKNLSTYSNIPVYSNTYISSSLSDNLIMGGKVILDPIDNPEYFTLGMKLHKGNMNVATPSTWVLNAINFYKSNDKYSIKTLPDAMFNFAGGEQLSPGEEKFLNKFFKDVKAGINITHTPFSISKISTAGADCEHGSIFYRLLREYASNLPYRIGCDEPIGMKVYDFVDIRVLRDDGTYCLPLEHGRVVVNSDCTMKEYSHNEEGTREFYIKDAFGKEWGNMNLYGYLDKKNNITLKSRLVNDGSIPTYKIADEILKDTKKIMSCEVVAIPYENGFRYVAHIVPQYNTPFNVNTVLNSAMQRCKKQFGDEFENILYFKIRDGYPLSNSAKRDVIALKQEGFDNCISLKPSNIPKLLRKTR